MIIASACLCGINCKYNGRNNLNNAVFKLFSEGKVIPVCPEQLGGMTTPRDVKEIKGGTGLEVLNGEAKVISPSGEDSTDRFIKGAYETLNIAKNANVKAAVLKAKSPSCGAGKIYDGTFNGKLIDGNGVASELLKINGIKVFTEEDEFIHCI